MPINAPAGMTELRRSNRPGVSNRSSMILCASVKVGLHCQTYFPSFSILKRLIAESGKARHVAGNNLVVEASLVLFESPVWM
jgi:hypothetical protein